MTGNVKAVTDKAFQNGPKLSQQVAEKYTYSDLVVDYLAQVGVEYVFGIQGGAIEPFFDALERRRRKGGQPDLSLGDRAQTRKRKAILFGPKAIFTRHEASAAFMADGCYRETGKLGVCCSTTGPGSTNLITGVASAYADKIPMLVITPQTALPSFGRSAFQESTPDAVNVVGMFEHCTRYNSLVSHADQLEGKLVTAITRAFQHPRGPVHLSIPSDILKAAMANMPTYLNVATQMREPWVVDQQALDHLKAEICSKTAQKQKVLLLLGHQCGDAIEDITRFSELLDADIISTPTGTRWVSAHNPRYKGVFGFSGHPSAKDALADPKLSRIIAVGTGLGETATAGWDTALLNNKLIHIESCAENFVQSPMAYMHVFGNIRSIFSELVDALLVRNEAESSKSHSRVPTSSINEDAIECSAERLPQQLRYYGAEKAYSDETPIKPQRLMHELSRLLPSHTRVYIDTGNSWAWGLHYLHLRLPGMQRLSMTFGSMGWAISAAVGSAVANRSAPFVCLTGDGSVLMSGQELTVAVEHHLPVLFVVLNDSGYGMIKHGQRLGGAESVGWQIPKVDFAVMARAMGANGIIIESVADLFSLNYDELFASSTPTLLDVRIDPDEVPPMGERVKILQQM